MDANSDEHGNSALNNRLRLSRPLSHAQTAPACTQLHEQRIDIAVDSTGARRMGTDTLHAAHSLHSQIGSHCATSNFTAT